MNVRLNKLLKNNKGSTLVTVVVALSLVGILASLILVITQNSYVTKSIDNQSKNNFYSAEEVVDQLKLGIQNEIAASMVDAYYDVISSFVFSEDSDAREKNFRKKTLEGNGTSYGGFISKIKLSPDGGHTNAVDVNKLNGLISDYYKNVVADKYRLDVPKNSTAYIAYEYDTSNYEYIIIRNIGVEYYNSVGYVNGLFTDIKITIPTPNFDLLDPNPNREYEKFALMARANVDLVQSGNAADVNGSIWIGKNLNIKNNSSRMSVDGENIYVGGTIGIGSCYNGTGNYSFSADYNNGKTNLCAGNISLDNSSSSSLSNALNINANTYVNNDLVFEGDNSNAVITGTYHGIGISTDTPDLSSAIIVNGRNNVLTASGLEQITIGGSSYIKTYQNGNYKVPNSTKSILTGDSVAPRSNELSYLVPRAYMNGLPNPVTRSDLAAAGYSSYDDLTTDINNLLNSSPLKQNGIITSEDGSYVKVLHYTYSNAADQTTANNMSVAYYYLNFVSATTAMNFYRDSVEDSTKKMLLGLIPVKLNVTSSDFKIVGVALSNLNAGSNGLTTDPTFNYGTYSPGDSTFTGAFATTFKNIKAFLTKDVPEKLQAIDDSLDPGSKFSERDAIDNIIDWNAIEQDTHSGYILHEDQLDGALGTVKRNGTEYPLRCRIYKGDSVTLSRGDVGNAFYGLIISTGDIIIQGNVEIHGLVIAGNKNTNDKGNIYIRNALGNQAKLVADSGAIRDIFNRSGLVHTTGGIYLSKILNGFDPNNTAGEKTELSTISLDNMFTYENWARN